MNVNDIHQSVKLTLPITHHEYKGNKDNCNFRHQKGQQDLRKQELHQQYTGEFLRDCIHGYGTYSWENIDTKYGNVCAGKFYANNIEGYACISYEDGRVFEGLFKENSRFGPGVLTYPDGTQDVGLWDGKYLVKLNQRPNNAVPFIAESVQGKAYLLKFKNLVPVQNKEKSFAYKLLSKFSKNEEILEKSDLLYSKFVKNTNSIFFDETLFNSNFFQDDEEWTIDVMECSSNCDTPVIKKVLVTHLLAWNNEKLCIDLMKHAFKHRNQEKILTFNVSNISNGQRKYFKASGFQENIALQFLHYCSDNNAPIISKLITLYDLYVDLCDCYGNTGIFYATSYDQTSVIEILTNYGANIDHLNDECLTALILSILRYTALKYDVCNWEKAFLPAVGVEKISPETQKWREHNYITSSGSYYQEYFYDLSCVRPPSKDAKNKKPVKEIKKKMKKEDEELNKPDMLERMVETAVCLLKCGAKPDYGLCPFPPLILSVFSRSPDILYALLTCGANPNIRTAYHLGSLTPLHIIASLSPSLELIPMAGYLMTSGADSSLRANTTHWMEETTELISNYEVESDEGKTALHLLCMRFDFDDDAFDYLGELCSLMIMLGANPNIEFVGHNALTLAIVRGNLNMISHVLDSGIVDPNQTLSNDMGVPLTVLVLRRYQSILPTATCQRVFNRLLEYNANPLNTVLGFNCNAMEFAYDENSIIEDKSGKLDKTMKSKGNDVILEVLRYAAEATAIKRIQKRVVEYLYQFKIECGFHDSLWDAIVKYIDVSRCLTVLQVLIDNDIIFPYKPFMVELLEYVSDSIGKKKVNTPKSKSTGFSVFDSMVDNIDLNKTEIREKRFAIMPELDPDESKFKVCFECFQKRNTVLMLCPKCHLVYFCSQACNIKNNKRKDTKHPCKILFYNSELQKMKECLEKGFPNCEPADVFGEYTRLRQVLIDSNPNFFNRGIDPDSQEKDLYGSSKMTARKLGSETSKSMSGKSDRKAKTQGTLDGSDGHMKTSKQTDKISKQGKGKGKKHGTGKQKKHDADKQKQAGTDKQKKDDLEKQKKHGTEEGKKDGEGQDDKDGLEDENDEIEHDEEQDDMFGDVSDEFRESVDSRCEKFDYKFYQMFMPFCICINNELYYKFDNTQKFFRLESFSNI